MTYPPTETIGDRFDRSGDGVSTSKVVSPAVFDRDVAHLECQGSSDQRRDSGQFVVRWYPLISVKKQQHLGDGDIQLAIGPRQALQLASVQLGVLPPSVLAGNGWQRGTQ